MDKTQYNAFAVSQKNFSQRTLMYTLTFEQMCSFMRGLSLSPVLESKAENVYTDEFGGKWHFKPVKQAQAA